MDEPKRITKTDEWILRIIMSSASLIFFSAIHGILENINCTGDCPVGGMGCYITANCHIPTGWEIPYWILFTILSIIGIYYTQKFITKYWLYEDENNEETQ